MKKPYPLNGIVPIVNTPFTQDDRIDIISLERLLEAGIADGVSGFIVPAVASEVSKLTSDERWTYTREVIRIVNRRVKVIIGASDPEPSAARALAEDAVSIEADGVLCAVPVPFIQDHDGAIAYFREVAHADMPMFMIQDLHWGGYGMARHTLMQLWEELDSFRCLKLETVPSGAKTTELLGATNNCLTIGCGWSLPQLIEALDRGTHFVTTTAINRPFIHVHHLYQAGCRDEARELFHRVVPFLAFAHQYIDISIHFYKRYCVRRGIFTTSQVRNPLMAFDAHHERVADELIEMICILEDELGPAIKQ
jgi:4-hydroxy-tetrahydrodipicolinate synthase